MSTRLSLVLIAPFWPQKGVVRWYCSFFGEKPLKLPLLWNLVVQPHIRKFHRSLEILHLHAWKRPVQKERLWRLLIWISRVPQQCSTRLSGLDSSNCVVNRISSRKATVQQITEFFIYLRRELRLSIPVMKGYCAALQHVFLLADADLAANRIISRMFHSFEKSCPPSHEVKSPEWNLSLDLQSLTHPLFNLPKLSSDKYITWEMCHVLAFALAKRVNEFHGLFSPMFVIPVLFLFFWILLPRRRIRQFMTLALMNSPFGKFLQKGPPRNWHWKIHILVVFDVFRTNLNFIFVGNQ